MNRLVTDNAAILHATQKAGSEQTQEVDVRALEIRLARRHLSVVLSGVAPSALGGAARAVARELFCRIEPRRRDVSHAHCVCTHTDVLIGDHVQRSRECEERGEENNY